MSDKDWILLGLVLGVPIGIALFWFFTQPRSVGYGPKTYSNLEEWEFTKDERDRVIGVKVKRTAEET